MFAVTAVFISSLFIPTSVHAQFSDCSVYFCKDMKYSWTKRADVYRLQVYLANNGFYGTQAIGQPVASGRYLTNTARAVWWFKNKYFLGPNKYYFGPQSRAVLNQLIAENGILATDPLVSTVSASNIQTNSVSFSASYSLPANIANQTVATWFEYATTDFPVAGSSVFKTAEQSITGLQNTFSASVATLSPSTLYYYRAAVRTATGVTRYSPTFTFTTGVSGGGGYSGGGGSGGGNPTASVVVSGETVTTTATTATFTAIGTPLNSGVLSSGSFWYGTTPGVYSGQLTATSVNTATGVFSVTASSLSPNTTYYYQACATSSTGIIGCSSQTNLSFTTSSGGSGGATPVVASVAVSAVSMASATVSASISNATTGAYVLYTDYSALSQNAFAGMTTSNTNSNVWQQNGTITNGSFTAALSGLTSLTTYGVKVCVSYNPAPICSSVSSFVTSGSFGGGAPVISALSAGANSTNGVASATITGAGITSYQFEYTTSANSFASPVPTVVVGSLSGTSYSATLSGLNLGSTYYYRLCATNSVGTTCLPSGNPSSNYIFSTGNPYITNIGPYNIGSTSVSVEADIDYSAGLTAYVKYSLAGGGTVYTTAPVSIPANYYTTYAFNQTITGLTPNTNYSYQVCVNPSSGSPVCQSGTTFVTSAGSTPVISAVSTNSITGSSASVSASISNATTGAYVLYTDYSIVSPGAFAAMTSPNTAAHVYSQAGVITSGTFSASLSGLLFSTVYGIRVCVTGSGSPVCSPVSSFTTTGPVGTPVVSSVASSNVGSTSAVITASFSNASSAYVRHATTASGVAAGTQTTAIMSGNTLSATLSGLSSSTQYYYQVCVVGSSTVCLPTTGSASYGFTTGVSSI